MSFMHGFFAGVPIGGVLALALFIWINRKKPEVLDKAEDVVRKG